MIKFIVIIIYTVKAYIRNGWDKEIVDPDNQIKPAFRVSSLASRWLAEA